ncbi:MAG TPA: transglutaminase domain-containing protein [Planktothrix sp.]|jgi:hypothetical protein
MSRVVSGIFWLLSRIVLSIVFYGTPLFGLWLASSLAAYLGGASWIPWVAGLLLFPLLPGLWEAHAYSHNRSTKKPWFTPVDRVSLRTFAIGLVFIVGMLSIYPQTAFVALSTRGDWMLDGKKDKQSEKIRHDLFIAAGAVEWLYNATKTNPYKSQIDSQAREVAEEATKERDKEAEQQRAKLAEKEAQQKGQSDQQSTSDEKLEKQLIDQQEEASQVQKALPKWPWKDATIDPIVTKIPAEEETSIASVAHYIAEHETDPMLRVKALHDYVADRVAYDSEAFYSGNMPDQSAEAVFENHKSVCAGYANLMSALGKACGEKIIVVVGDARDDKNGDKLSGYGHAWNAARINNQWYLMDACWDAGYVSRERGFTKKYTTSYLLPPPEVMIQNHFPEDSSWQLLAKPLSQGEFLRQPMLAPDFQAAGLKLVAPRRSVNDVTAEAMTILKNPQKQWLMVALQQDGKPIGEKQTSDNESAQFVVPIPDKGTYRLNYYVSENKSEYARYKGVGSVDFVNR